MNARRACVLTETDDHRSGSQKRASRTNAHVALLASKAEYYTRDVRTDLNTRGINAATECESTFPRPHFPSHFCDENFGS